MGEFADDALDEILDDLEMWELDGPPQEDDYPLFHPMKGDGTLPTVPAGGKEER